MRQRNPLRFARHLAHALGAPVLGRLHDAFLARGDEVPRHEAPPFQRLAADHDELRIRAGQHALGRGRVEQRHRVQRQRHAVHFQRAADGVDGRFRRQAGQADLLARLQRHIQIQGLAVGAHGRGLAEGAADQHPHPGALHRQLGNLVGRRVAEARLIFLVRQRQRGPQLQAVGAVRAIHQVLGRALGVDDAASGRHPVDGARFDALHGADAVAVVHRPFEQIGDRGQADVGMGPHVVVGARRHVHRAEMVEEDERAHGLLDGGRQETPHHQAAAQILLVAF